MRKLFFVITLLLIAPAFACRPPADTVVYIVRHAEKLTVNPDDKDPELSADGRQRAQDLARHLKGIKFGAIFSTRYKRNLQTAAPLARQAGLPIASYNGDDFEGIANTIRSKYKGRNTLLVGHSNTVLELVKAFGTKPPADTLADDDYDLLFKITLHETGNKPDVTRYGKKHHSTAINGL